MKIEFVKRETGPERMVCEAELLFDDDSDLAGMKLVGFTLWRGNDGAADIYVTFPSRAFGAGTERKFFDYLRTTDGSSGPREAVKRWILDEYHKHQSKEIAARETSRR